MDHSLAIRVLSLYGPAALVALAWALRPGGTRRAVAALLASAWQLPALLFVNVVATSAGWWTFAASSAALARMPLELLLGWVLLWGAVPVLLLSRLPLLAVVAILVSADLVLMPLAAPVLQLGDAWLLGESFAVAVALVPGQLFARWTIEDRRVGFRAMFQAVAFGATLLWVLPLIVFEIVGGDWTALRHGWRSYAGIPLQLAMLPVLLGVSAVSEFAERGQGTPIPFDPPKRLVTSGPYAYVANPMQLSMALVLVAWGALLRNEWIALAGPMSVVYSLGLAALDEHIDLADRFGDAWQEYRRHVRAWLPRWRPYYSPSDSVSPARLYVAFGCNPCYGVAQWFESHRLSGLEIVPAELHPTRDLIRVTYDPANGSREDIGVAAVARALEHIHLGWALLGWFMRLPLVTPALQFLVDASGGEARLIRRVDPGETGACPTRSLYGNSRGALRV